MRHIPNILTLFRMLLVPVFAYVTLSVEPVHKGALIGLIIFTVASITDYLDGLIARRANLVSNFGKIADPLADKLLVLTALVVLRFLPGQVVAAWVIFAVALREVLVSFLRQYHAARGVFIPANIWGKAKAFLQMAGIIAALLFQTLDGYYPAAFADPPSRWYLGLKIAFWVLALVTVMSGLTYMRPPREDNR